MLGRPGIRRGAVAGVVLIAAVAVIAVVSHGGGSHDVFGTFNACLGQERFLVTTEHRSGGRAIDTIRDRAQDAVVGEFAVLPSLHAAETFTSTTVGPPGGTGERNGRMVLFTKVPSGRDANAILTCAAPQFPPA